MLSKLICFVIACAVTVSCLDDVHTSDGGNWMDSGSKKLIRQSPWSEGWNDWKKGAQLDAADDVERHGQNTYGMLLGQGKPQGLDSSSESQENSNDLAENIEYKQIQKVYHDTDPEQAGNGRVITTKTYGSGNSNNFNDFEDDVNNKINKDNHN